MGAYAVAVDVGGTFTDIALCNLGTNEQRVFKTPSTPEDPAVGFITGLAEILAAAGVGPGEVAHIFYGTTIATNPVLENEGARQAVSPVRLFRFRGRGIGVGPATDAAV